MTIYAYLVNMSPKAKEELERAWADLAGPAVPSDAKERKQRRILEAATELFVEQGYRKTSVDEIARHAHVAKGTVYLYFPSKAHLLMGAIAHEERTHGEALLAPVMDTSRPTRERMIELLTVSFSLPQQMPLLSRLMTGDQELAIALQDAEAEAPDLLESTEAAWRHLLGALVGEAHGDDASAQQLDERARVLFGLLFFAGSLHRAEIRQGLSVERFASVLAEMLVDGVVPPDPRSPS